MITPTVHFKEPLMFKQRTLLLIGLLFSLFCLAACTAGQRQSLLLSGSLIAETKAADHLLQSGEVERAVFSISLPEEHRATVVAGFDDFALSRTVLADLGRNPAALVNAITTIQAERARLRNAYGEIKTVVETHWENYGPAEQAKLKRWQAQAHRLDGRYNAFVQAVNQEISSDARQQAAVEILRVVAQLALMAA